MFLGQDYKDGWTFANQVVGSAVPVRFVHRKAGLNDLQFATYDVVPCNHDWKHDLDFFVSCSECRSRVKIDNSAKHITPGLPVEPKGCGECKRRWVRVMDWLCAACSHVAGGDSFWRPGVCDAWRPDCTCSFQPLVPECNKVGVKAEVEDAEWRCVSPKCSELCNNNGTAVEMPC